MTRLLVLQPRLLRLLAVEADKAYWLGTMKTLCVVSPSVASVQQRP